MNISNLLSHKTIRNYCVLLKFDNEFVMYFIFSYCNCYFHFVASQKLIENPEQALNQTSNTYQTIS